uniref:Uncharacterized protein n=1 Tax=Grammatophora oceanica TaxID=210454 RepID=A0A7S1VVT8_9STRA|mmetsp:Transcript_9692/g.14281  ORF Transcript_9692/g.14281 Transcript_9692/m.14281 type:complete len:199 (+) Transcript_9692:100-696(+)
MPGSRRSSPSRTLEKSGSTKVSSRGLSRTESRLFKRNRKLRDYTKAGREDLPSNREFLKQQPHDQSPETSPDSVASKRSLYQQQSLFENYTTALNGSSSEFTADDGVQRPEVISFAIKKRSSVVRDRNFSSRDELLGDVEDVLVEHRCSLGEGSSTSLSAVSPRRRPKGLLESVLQVERKTSITRQRCIASGSSAASG